MTTIPAEAQVLLQKAREALRQNDLMQARILAQQAARIVPDSEDPWLILAAASDPEQSVAYIKRALDINPNSPRAERGMQWALRRVPQAASSSRAAADRVSATPTARSGSSVRRWALGVAGAALVALSAWTAYSNPDTITSISKAFVVAEPAHASSWAQVEIPKPVVMAPLVTPAPTATPLPVATDTATLEPSPTATSVPTETATIEPSATATAITDTATGDPDAFSMQVLVDTPTPEWVPTAVPPTVAPSVPDYSATGGEHWIDVDLSQQMVYAYAGNTVVNSFLVSTGTWEHPTVTGQYYIYVKYLYTDMIGPDYYLPNVPYTMYFYKGYGLHGTYWHSNFGTPMSHGCVNLRISDAAWLFDFASIGTLVNVHY